MKFKLVTLAGEKINEEVYSVTIPTIDGEISVITAMNPYKNIDTSIIILFC